jgi:hypothetical protein
VTVERQVGAAWQVAASYLGSHTDRLWNQLAINPGVFLGLAPCTLDGVFYASCSTSQNLNRRRELSLSGENPDAARLIGHLDLHTNLGTQDYRGLKLSFQRRAAAGVSLNGTYTVSRCYGDPARQSVSALMLGSGYTNPDDPAFDRGVCDQDRTHLGSFTVVAETPRFVTPALRWFFSDWRIAGIVSARSGTPINVTGPDRAGTGILNQRVNQVLANPYGDRTSNRWLNPAAFELPAPGTLGNFPRNGARGPGFWTVDASLSRVVSPGATARMMFRVEAFNLFNTVNWNSPEVNFTSSTFGRITSIAGTPRVLQFGVRYSF